ncbi:MAG: KR domain-containing protein, partial [Phycisphaerales bacterium]
NFAAFQAMGALARGGRCRAFDQRADGFVPSEGVAVVVLRPLADALAAGDTIHAVLRGSATNNDGRSNGLTAPNPAAQREVLLDAWRQAGLAAGELSYLEAHGTGTALGDPIEVEAYRAAAEALSAEQGAPAPRQTCYVGSVKSNLGHAEAAAGIAGLVKLILCLEHRELVPTLHLAEPNRHIAFESSPLVPVDRRRPWQVPPGQKRVAGLSAFGFGGTNVHLVVEEAPQPAPAPDEPPRPEVFVLSARSQAALRRLVAAHASALRDSPHRLGDLCFTLQAGRLHQRQRLAIVASTRAELRSKLALLEPWEGRFGHRELAIFAGPAEEQPGAAGETAVVSPAPSAPESARQRQLEELAARYARGETIDWSAVQEHEAPRRRVPLPLYPFEQRRYWLDSPPVLSAIEGPVLSAVEGSAVEGPVLSAVEGPAVKQPVEPGDASAGGGEDLAAVPARTETLWQLAWRPRPLAPSLMGDADSALADRSALAGRWLVFAAGEAAAAALAAWLSAGGGEPLVARAGETLDPTVAADYRRLIDEALAGGPLAGVLWEAGWGTAAAATAADSTAREEPLFHLAQALLPRAGELRCVVLSRGVQRALPGEPGDTALATTLALAQALSAEGRGWRVRALDWEAPTTAAWSDEELGQLAAELAELRASGEGPPEVAYRDGVRLAPRVEPLEVTGDDRAGSASSSPWRAGGTYLVTGGLSGIGRALAGHLAKRYQARLWLVGRTPLEDSPSPLVGAGQGEGDPGASRAAALAELRALTPAVEYRAVDVGDRAALAALLAELQGAGETLDGVIHAAGVLETDQLALRTKSLAVWRATLAAKVAGSRALWELTAADRQAALAAGRDWPLVLLSSIASLSPPLAAGQSDYAAANRYQRALAHELSVTAHDSSAARPRVTALVLSEWAGLGMVARHGVGPIVRRLGLLPLAADEALDAFERATASPACEVLFLRGR